MKSYQLIWKLIKNGLFADIEMYGAIDKQSVIVKDVRFCGKKYDIVDGHYIKNKKVTRIAGFGEYVDTYHGDSV